MKEGPFRIGTTSYIIPADILPNVQYLADKVNDVELVLFEVDDGGGNLPDADILEELSGIAERNDLTYTVHLPLDLQLGEDGELMEFSLRKALQVIAHMRALQPFAYVLHLDGRSVRQAYGSQRWQAWCERTRLGLARLVGQMDNPGLMAVENLDGYAPEFWDAVLTGLPVRRCIDLGHLWFDGHDPLPYLEKHIADTSVIHIHGHAQRDHQSLCLIAPEELARVIDFLIMSNYTGVLTMEIFGEPDFQTSLDVILNTLRDMKLEARWENR